MESIISNEQLLRLLHLMSQDGFLYCVYKMEIEYVHDSTIVVGVTWEYEKAEMGKSCC